MTGTQAVRHSEKATRDGLAWWTAVTLLSVVLLAPLAMTDVPPLLDYPNHLARLALLAAGPDDPMARRFVVPAWSIVPNLAADVIGPPLARMLPIHLAGRCLLGGALLLNFAGVLALHRALFRRRSFWPLGSCLVACNSTFLLGFLNFQIATGLAMLSAAAWFTWRERRPAVTIAGAAAASVLLFFCHLMGLAFFLLLIGGAELRGMRTFRAALARTGCLLVVLAGPALLSVFAVPFGAPIAAHWPRLDVKLVNAASPFINYLFPLDMITAGLTYGGIVLGLATRTLTLAPRAAVTAAVLPAAYFAFPFDLMGTSFLDMRFAVMTGYLAFAAVDPVRPGPAGWRIALIGGAMLFAVRTAVVAGVWTEHRRDLAALRAAIAVVPSGAAVFFTNVPAEEAPAYWDAGPLSRRLSNGLRADYHLPALLFIERGAFWPGLFANPAQQPIRLLPAYQRLAREEHDMPSHAALVADPGLALPALDDFDFVLMLEAGADPDLAGFIPRCLSLLSRSDFAALFRVRRDCVPDRPR